MKKLLLILISTIGFTSLLHAQTDVLHIKPTGMLIDYENNSTHDASALLQLGSDNTSTQGFLAPRVALTAANVATPITTPATGLLIFNTTTANTGAAAPPNDITPGYYYNAGSSVAPQWVRLITGGTANAWTLTGNTGTTASTAAIGATVNNNFIGTTDAKDFVMATSNLERMRITSNGNVGIGTITPASKLHINHAFTSDLNERAARIITSNTQTITASRQLTGLYVEALNRQTETTPSGVTPTSSLVYALDGVAYTNDTRTFNWLRGGNFTAYSTSTSATDQDAIAGSFSHGYFNAVSPGAATSVYGAYNQGSNNNTGSISSGLYGSMNVGYNNNTGSVAAIFGSYNQAYNNSTGAVTTAYGSYNRAFINTSSGDLTNAYGTFNYVFKNSNATGTITNAYGTFSQVTNAYDAATGSIPTGYAYYGTVTKATNANDYTNAYGIRLNVAAGVTRWGVYTENEHKNYFSGNVGITASSPVSRLDLGSALAANKPLLRYNPGVATAVDYTGYAHHDFLLGGYVTGGYSQNYISFGHNTDINRKFHIGSASNSAFDGTTTFVPAVTVMSGGNVGIGTQTPGAKLAVNGVTSVGAGEKLSLIGLDINSGVTPNFIKIITTIPAASGSADFTVNIKGFRYGSAEMTDLTIGWHWWTGTFYNPSVSSSGSWAPVVRLSAEGGFVAIVLSAPGYWPKLYVESMYSSAYNDQYSTGWSWTDADASGSPHCYGTIQK
jgi:hypothetical protein